MKVLIIGGGGREHAMAWKAAQSQQVRAVYVAPGNAGTAREPKCRNIPIAADDIEALLAFAQDEAIDLTLVGPEMPLVKGIVDRFASHGLRCLGPSRLASRLEGSKSFAKRFMAAHGIPTAAFATFTEIEPAIAYIRKIGPPLVVKADGLAAGKGVIIAQSEEEAIRTVKEMLEKQVFGEAGKRVVIEEFLKGEEASFIVLVDGRHILPLATSRDHKARDDGDKGPNTGGMGAYSPTPAITPAMENLILDKIIRPTVEGMAEEGHPYRGFLYAGLMLTDGAPKVLEFNCRLGDPEAQPILMRLRSDFMEACEAALEGCLDRIQLSWDPRFALGVVMASQGYPGPYRKGDIIYGLPEREEEDVKVFHAGTAEKDGRIVTAGGRVLCVTALGKTLADARTRAYEVVQQIHWEGAFYRRDIGSRAITREPR